MIAFESEKKLVGYRSRLCVRPGESIDFMVHSHDGRAYEADLVRLVHAELNEKRGGPGLVVEEIPAAFAGSYAGEIQDLRIGSFLHAELTSGESAKALSFAVAVFPTLYLERDQTIAEICGPGGTKIACLRLAGRGRLELEAGGRRESLELPIPLHRWSFIGFSVQDGRASLFQMPEPEGPGDDASRYEDSRSWEIADLPELRCSSLTLASRFEDPGRPSETWNGRMDSPRLVSDALSAADAKSLVLATGPDPHGPAVLGFWDFSRDMDQREVVDLGSNSVDTTTHQLPTRAVRGFRWTGDERDWRRAPLEYGAIHFHDDDVYDMGWPTAFCFTVPDDLRSGAYAARLRLGDETEYLTFFVSPAPSRNRKLPPIALVLPTVSYLSYANEVVHVTGPKALYDITRAAFPEAAFHVEHNAFGRSHYESHNDGSGVHFSSWLRPLWNVRPNSRAWMLPADSNLIHWLEARGFDYDVLTDHDLHERGVEALEGYRVVMTGTHPEYLSTQMFDAYEQYMNRGGRLMYMGGNGFYWRVALSDHWPAATELRRAEDGTRAWASKPGEYHHAFGGEIGGLWRRQERSPNRLVGTGFSAQGFFKGRPYIKNKAAEDPRAAFIFDGVESRVLGDHGRRCKGVVGEEIDRYDIALGSPPHALVLASSEEFDGDMMLTKEDLLMNIPAQSQTGIRADMVFFETPAKGAVFSASSIAWSSSLDYDDYDNDIARISENVLRRFSDPEPFEMPPIAEPEVPSIPTHRLDGARITG